MWNDENDICKQASSIVLSFIVNYIKYAAVVSNLIIYIYIMPVWVWQRKDIANMGTF